ncbi:phospholipase D family protein [Rubritalea halochordaticola]
MQTVSRALSLLPLSICLPLVQCTMVPKVEDKPVTKSLSPPKSGVLAETARRLENTRDEEQSSLLLLDEAKEALEWRLALVDSAKSSIDIQLYLWHDGASGKLLLDRVLRAADRGVRVRILVDDFLFNGNEPFVSSICRYHPNIDIRIFNPTSFRGNPLGSSMEFLLNFAHLNRRMHNKTWTADQSFSIVGGRNVGDHYYGLDEHYNFLDLDVLVSGPPVREVAKGFDLFWNSAQAYPGALLSKRAKREILEERRARLLAYLDQEKDGMLRSFPTRPKDWSREFARLPHTMAKGKAVFIQDHPDREQDNRQLVTSLGTAVGKQSRELILVSPYFIPGKGMLESMEQAVKEGKDVHVLAPSLAANNQPAAHGHYKKKRKPTLRTGAKLYELRSQPDKSVRMMADVSPVRSKIVAMHTKAIVGDRTRCFIGSMNLDPRAIKINTESGMLIDSPELTADLFSMLQKIRRSESVWEVTLDERNKLRWSENGVNFQDEPPAPWMKKVTSRIVGWLPLESQL